MNYAGHEKLRAEVAEVANAMCDLRTTMNEMEQRYTYRKLKNQSIPLSTPYAT
ncbi:TPA: hypothetical protein KII43_004492 [Escherichia coli]|nr:hypothetical protein [Escherichia coli]